MAKFKSLTATTPIFRVSYPALFEPKLNTLNNKMEWSVQALFPKGEKLEGLKAAVKEVIEERWGKDQNKWPKGLRLPFKLQDDREKIDEKTQEKYLPAPYEYGCFYLNLKSSKERPGLVMPDAKTAIIDASDFYAGCFARAKVSVFTYDQAGNRGVSFGLQHIQKYKDGEPLGGRTRVEDAFEAIADSDSGAAAGTSADALFSL